jgi:hypothetical protein
MSFRRHLNGLEFCYRTLIDCLGFESENIHVLSYEGSLHTWRESEEPHLSPVWPGDQTPYRLPVTDEGSREGFRGALAALGRKLGPEDQLFINITGSGGNHGHGRGPDVIVYPNARRYRRDDFCADIATLPPHRSLFVLMSQCFAGGFNQGVVEASRARETFVAAAAAEDSPSFALPDDLRWDSFQRNFIAALAGQDVDGRPLASDVIPYGSTTARAAFEYALTAPIRSLYDSPEFAAKPEAAMHMTLDRD